MADTIMRIIFFVWFLYRHAYHNYEWGKAKYEYDLLSSGLHNDIIQDNDDMKRVIEEDLKNSHYLDYVISSIERNMRMHKLLANGSAFLCAMYLLHFIVN